MVAPPSSEKRGRTLVLAFDGTSNQFSDSNTNVVKLCSALKLDDPDKQMVYYQPGIGTYTDPSLTLKGKLYVAIAKVLDMAFAWYINAHILGGYTFLMQNYKPGDRICMIGFSRGSYTARALTAMLHTVGLLYKDNIEQVEFAYGLYVKRDPLTAKFKKTFSQDVKVEFMGVWDTVASVGLLMSPALPFSSSNTIRVFRHAISLDEHRSKYNVVLWQSDDERLYEDPTRPESDVDGVIEMWFAGVHSDVGGSAVPDEEPHSLGHITFRWMLHEIHRSKCGILFDDHALRDLGIPTESVPPLSTEHGHAAPDLAAAPSNQAPDCTSAPPHPPIQRSGFSSFLRALKFKAKTDVPVKEALAVQSAKSSAALDKLDALTPMHDQLVANPLWWLLQTPTWYRGELLPDFSGRRRFPTDEVQRKHQRIHPSVEIRVHSKDPNVAPYIPRARFLPN